MDSTKIVPHIPFLSLNEHCKFNNLNITHLQVTKSHFNGCHFNGKLGKNVIFENCTFFSCVFDSLDLEHCIFKNCTFKYCNFIASRFIACQFSHSFWQKSTSRHCQWMASALDQATLDFIYGPEELEKEVSEEESTTQWSFMLKEDFLETRKMS